jgi:hypothetical protein
MMIKLFATLALCTAAVTHAADFTGYYAPANWTTTVDGNGSVLASSSFIALVSTDEWRLQPLHNHGTRCRHRQLRLEFLHRRRTAIRGVRLRAQR